MIFCRFSTICVCLILSVSFSCHIATTRLSVLFELVHFIAYAIQLNIFCCRLESTYSAQCAHGYCLFVFYRSVFFLQWERHDKIHEWKRKKRKMHRKVWLIYAFILNEQGKNDTLLLRQCIFVPCVCVCVDKNSARRRKKKRKEEMLIDEKRWWKMIQINKTTHSSITTGVCLRFQCMVNKRWQMFDCILNVPRYTALALGYIWLNTIFVCAKCSKDTKMAKHNNQQRRQRIELNMFVSYTLFCFNFPQRLFLLYIQFGVIWSPYVIVVKTWHIHANRVHCVCTWILCIEYMNDRTYCNNIEIKS